MDMDMERTRKPYVINVIEACSPQECTQCGAPCRVRITLWLDEARHEANIANGMDIYEAAEELISRAIDHQSDPAAIPFEGMYMCGRHLVMGLMTILRQRDMTPPLLELCAQFANDPNLRIYVFDLNKRPRNFTPAAAATLAYDIPSFIDSYLLMEKELGI